LSTEQKNYADGSAKDHWKTVDRPDDDDGARVTTSLPHKLAADDLGSVRAKKRHSSIGQNAVYRPPFIRIAFLQRLTRSPVKNRMPDLPINFNFDVRFSFAR
jgi:hypothetical protein